MAIFDFLKTKKEETGSKFIGRWVQAMKSFKLLGQEFSIPDFEVVMKSDSMERQEIIKKVEKIEWGINCGDLKHIYGAADVFKEMGNIISEGMQNCVLLNDNDLKERCFEIRKKTRHFLQNEANKTDGRNLNLQKADYVIESIGDIANINLGGLLTREKESEKMGDPEKAWFIIRLLENPQKLHITFMLNFQPDKKEIMDLADRLLGSGKIDNNQFTEISETFDDLFKMGQEYQNKTKIEKLENDA